MPSLPPFPYGAVYFRKSNPPREDWERDYATAAADGMNCFRHWFLWSAIEVAPNTFDWADYDAQLDLAARHGIKTIVAEMMTAAPEWAWHQLAHARYQARDGTPAHSTISASCATGGFPGLCLDNDDARALAERFLTQLVERYRDHPDLGAYDIWNECNVSRQYCYCPATRARFRDWLREKYGDLKGLGNAWYRHSYTSWDEVQPPPNSTGYPESLDWIQFRIDNAYRLMRWRAAHIRRLDPHHPVTAHGVTQTLTDHAPSANDEWRAAAEVDSYGFTWIAARRGDEPWKAFQAVDIVRAGCRGKRFWHAEAQAGPLWMQPQVAGRPRDDGRIATPEDICYWNLVSFAGGATGWLCPRWRPLLDGPLFGAFGMYGLDGARTPRSAMTGRIAKWANAPEQAALWRARPVRGEAGILFVPESNHFAYVQQGHTDWYAEAARGAYQGFFDLGLQPDWVHVDDLFDQNGEPAPYRLLYLPYPIHLRRSTAETLRAWVERGGTLVSEGCPGYFGDRGRAGTVQPNLGLDALFGARERYVEFTPDVSDDLTFSMDGIDAPVPGALVLQAYEPAEGTAAGWYPEGYSFAGGLPAVVDHHYGAGRTRLIGTFPGVGRTRAGLPVERRGAPSGTTFTTHQHAEVTGRPSDERLASAQAFYRGLIEWAGITPHVQSNDPRVIVRLHQDGETRTVALWALNPTREARTVRLTLSDAWGPFAQTHVHWGEPHSVSLANDRTVIMRVAARDGAVVRLEPS
ncbi:MAG: beta-galactosidase [Chloroflexi bacterium]|nr:beta-galactosidase [Chloroflexota bacterium]